MAVFDFPISQAQVRDLYLKCKKTVKYVEKKD